MRGLFYNIIENRGYGYFVELHSNLLVEYDLTERKIKRTLSLKNYYTRNKGVAEIGINGSSLILYPSWSDLVLIIDIDNWSVKEKIKLDEAMYDGLWCDYRPIFMDYQTPDKVLMYRGRESCEIFELDITTGQISALRFNDNMNGEHYEGYGEAYVSKCGQICFTTYKDTDYLALLSVKEKTVNWYKTGCGIIRHAIEKKGLYWVVNKSGDIRVWTPDKGVIMEISVPDEQDQYIIKNPILFDVNEGVWVGGLYTDGSYLKIHDDYAVERIRVSGLDFMNNRENDSETAINIRLSPAYNRSFIQLRTGVYALRDDNDFTVFDPIDIPLEKMGIRIFVEEYGYRLNDYIKDIV